MQVPAVNQIMAKEKIEPAFLFIDQSKMVLYCPSFVSGLSMQFPESLITHMEITDSQKMYEWMEGICRANKIPKLTVLLAYTQSMYFQKQLPMMEEGRLNDEDKKFCHATPFDRVTTHAYKNQQGTLLVSINRDFYDTLRQGLARCEFDVLGVIPQFALEPFIPKEGMSVKVISSLFAKIELLKDQGIVVTRQAPQTLQEKQEYYSTHYQGVVVIVFILFLLAVFGVTGFILQRQFRVNQAPVTPTVSSVQPVDQAPQEPSAISDFVASPSAVASESALRVHIRYPSTQASESAQLLRTLEQNGFTQVSREIVQGLTIKSIVMVFRPGVPQARRIQLQSIVQTGTLPPSVQENAELDVDVSITLPQ